MRVWVVRAGATPLRKKRCDPLEKQKGKGQEVDQRNRRNELGMGSVEPTLGCDPLQKKKGSKVKGRGCGLGGWSKLYCRALVRPSEVGGHMREAT